MVRAAQIDHAVARVRNMLGLRGNPGDEKEKEQGIEAEDQAVNWFASFSLSFRLFYFNFLSLGIMHFPRWMVIPTPDSCRILESLR